MTLFHVVLALLLVPAVAYAVGRGMEDSGLSAALFLALAVAALVFGATGLAAGTPTAGVTLLIGLPVMLLAAGAARAGGGRVGS
jgi:hypothetical protein